MRKLFRFKYEPCNGTCYAWCSKLPFQLRQLNSSDRIKLVETMVQAHNKLCDNPAYSFGLDVDEKNNVFVSHFRTPEKTNLYSSASFSECVELVCNEVLSTPIPQVDDHCNFGNNGAEDLGNEILKFCTNDGFKELQERHCECKSHAS